MIRSPFNPLVSELKPTSVSVLVSISLPYTPSPYPLSQTPSSLLSTTPHLSSRHQRFDKHHPLSQSLPDQARLRTVGKLCSTLPSHRDESWRLVVWKSAEQPRLCQQTLNLFPLPLTALPHAPWHPPTNLPSLPRHPARPSPHLPRSRALLQPIPTLLAVDAQTVASQVEHPDRTRIRPAVMATVESAAETPPRSVEVSSLDHLLIGTMGK
jgi:hypothetical protein